MQDEDYTKPKKYKTTKTSGKDFLRMRARTAKEQHAAALDALKGPDDVPLPDADDSSLRGVLT